jgi:peptide-methionine (R)-S-oxide reductase
MQRRNFIGFLLASTAGACLGGAPALAAFPVTKSDAEWKKALSPAAYDVLRHQGTEMPFSSPLDMNTKKGTYSCAGCGVPLFSSDTKYDSKTGWPSFGWRGSHPDRHQRYDDPHRSPLPQLRRPSGSCLR